MIKAKSVFYKVACPRPCPVPLRFSQLEQGDSKVDVNTDIITEPLLKSKSRVRNKQWRKGTGRLACGGKNETQPLASAQLLTPCVEVNKIPSFKLMQVQVKASYDLVAAEATELAQEMTTKDRTVDQNKRAHHLNKLGASLLAVSAARNKTTTKEVMEMDSID